MSPSPLLSQERLDAARQAVSEAKKQNSGLADRVQVLKTEQRELEVQKEELEGQVRQQQEVRTRDQVGIGDDCPMNVVRAGQRTILLLISWAGIGAGRQ